MTAGTVLDFAEKNLRTTRFESSIRRLFCGLEFVRSLTRRGGMDVKGSMRKDLWNYINKVARELSRTHRRAQRLPDYPLPTEFCISA